MDADISTVIFAACARYRGKLRWREPGSHPLRALPGSSSLSDNIRASGGNFSIASQPRFPERKTFSLL